MEILKMNFLNNSTTICFCLTLIFPLGKALPFLQPILRAHYRKGFLFLSNLQQVAVTNDLIFHTCIEKEVPKS